MRLRHTIVSALVGALVALVLSVLPFSTVLGGVAAGFLEGPDGRDGALAGALSGLIVFVPFGLLVVMALGLFGFGVGVAGLPVEGFVVVALLLGFGLSVVFAYTVGLATLGGYLGSLLAREYPDRRTRTRESIGMSSRQTEPPTADRTPSERRSEPTRWREPPEGHDDRLEGADVGADRRERDRSEEGDAP